MFCCSPYRVTLLQTFQAIDAAGARWSTLRSLMMACGVNYGSLYRNLADLHAAGLVETTCTRPVYYRVQPKPSKAAAELARKLRALGKELGVQKAAG